MLTGGLSLPDGRSVAGGRTDCLFLFTILHSHGQKHLTDVSVLSPAFSSFAHITFIFFGRSASPPLDAFLFVGDPQRYGPPIRSIGGAYSPPKTTLCATCRLYLLLFRIYNSTWHHLTCLSNPTNVCFFLLKRTGFGLDLTPSKIYGLQWTGNSWNGIIYKPQLLVCDPE